MNVIKIPLFYFIYSSLLPLFNCIEPITLTSAGFAAAGAGYYFKCKAIECCDDNWIPANIPALKSDLNDYFIGQHIAEDVIFKSLKSHFYNNNPRKALVLSFHGWPGSGKNFLAERIAKHFYHKGMDSSYVKFFYGMHHFPLASEVDNYKKMLKDTIMDYVKRCPRSLFVFDEVDKMPETLLDVLKPFIDYHPHIDNIDYRKATFIFLSNTGSSEINKIVIDAWLNGMERKNLKISTFENLISHGAFNEKGGLHRSSNIESILIDHYVPFLPMEDIHVKQCTIQEFKNQHISNPPSDMIDKVMESITFGPEEIKKFSKSGCKLIAQRVSFLITKFNLEEDEKHEEKRFFNVNFFKSFW